MRGVCAILCLLAVPAIADDNRPLADRARQYLIDLVKIDTSNPPGNETKVAEYLKEISDGHGLAGEILGGDPKRMNFVARLRGTGKGRPVLLLAHSDVAPADRAQWTVDPFGGEIRNAAIYGRGVWDDKSLLAADLAVMVEIKRRNIKLNRDVILLSEADEEEGATGIQWMVKNAWPKIDAEFALGEGGYIIESKDGPKLFEVETTEKIPSRIVLTARGTTGHGSLPRSDNALVHLSKALVRLTEADQPIHLSPPTRRYLREVAKLTDYAWLAPLLPKLDNPATSQAAAAQIRAKEPGLDALLHTTLSPTMLRAGNRGNVIPNGAEAQIDVRSLPGELVKICSPGSGRSSTIARWSWHSLPERRRRPATRVRFQPRRIRPWNGRSSGFIHGTLWLRRCHGMRPTEVICACAACQCMACRFSSWIRRIHGSTAATSTFWRRTSTMGSSCCGRLCWRLRAEIRRPTRDGVGSPLRLKNGDTPG